jgi:mannose-6-phosphate isomerase-like protein (cupin superfamily)
LSDPPWHSDSVRRIEPPFNLKDWINRNRSEIVSDGSKRLFSDSYQSDVVVLGLGSGSRSIRSDGGETFLWIIEGHAKVVVQGRTFNLKPDETILIPPDQKFQFIPCSDAIALSTLMDPKNRARAGY